MCMHATWPQWPPPAGGLLMDEQSSRGADRFCVMISAVGAVPLLRWRAGAVARVAPSPHF